MLATIGLLARANCPGPGLSHSLHQVCTGCIIRLTASVRDGEYSNIERLRLRVSYFRQLSSPLLPSRCNIA